MTMCAWHWRSCFLTLEKDHALTLRKSWDSTRFASFSVHLFWPPKLLFASTHRDTQCGGLLCLGHPGTQLTRLRLLREEYCGNMYARPLLRCVFVMKNTVPCTSPVQPMCVIEGQGLQAPGTDGNEQKGHSSRSWALISVWAVRLAGEGGHFKTLVWLN